MARTPSGMDVPFHPDIGFLAQRRRGLLGKSHKAKGQTRRLSFRRRPTSRDQPLPRGAQSAIKSLHLDRRSRQNHRRSQARAPSVRFDPLVVRVQHDDRYLAFGLERVIGVRRPEFERLLPKSRAFLARRCPGSRLQLLGPYLDLHIRVSEDVAVPPGVFGRTTLRSDDEVRVAVRSVIQREYELLAGLAASGGEQQRRRRNLTAPRQGRFLHVSVGPAAGEIAVGVLDHPVRQIRSEFRFSHHALLQSSSNYSAARRVGQCGGPSLPCRGERKANPQTFVLEKPAFVSLSCQAATVRLAITREVAFRPNATRETRT